MLPNAAHDQTVMRRALAAAIADASRRQRERVLATRSTSLSPRFLLSTDTRPRTVEPRSAYLPVAPVKTLDTQPLRDAARAQQRDALATRARAKAMLSRLEEMRARIREHSIRMEATAARRLPVRGAAGDTERQ